MKNHKTISCLSLILLSLLWSCQKPDHQVDDSVRWFQQSAECRALFLQTYGLATSRLKAISINPEDKAPAIVIDIDETILDNSPQAAGVALGQHPDARRSWDEWCQAAQAEPLPGSLDFLSEADRLGVAVFYVSNRDHKHLQATLDNLRKWGFPQVVPQKILLRESDSSKEPRRRSIAEHYRIVMFLGDSLGDLSSDFETQSAPERSRQVDLHQGDFGSLFVVFPNPMYGSWEKMSKGIPLKTWPDTKKTKQK